MSSEKLVIIDAFDFLHRAYHVIPKNLTNRKGQSINAVFGFTLMLLSLIEKLKPDYLIVAMEGGAPTFRVEEFKAYKATRKKDEERDRAFEEQIPIMQEVLEAFGAPCLFYPGFEADDVIGTVISKIKVAAASYAAQDGEGKIGAIRSRNYKNLSNAVVVTHDQDLLQLVDEGVVVFMPKKGKSGDRTFAREDVVREYGLTPAQIVDFKALSGDQSDNIPGVYGIGEAKALALVREFGTVEEIYENLSAVDEKTAKLLAEGIEEAKMSKWLATVRFDAPVEVDLEKCQLTGLKDGRGLKKLKELGFKSLAKRLEKSLVAGGEKKAEGGQMALI